MSTTFKINITDFFRWDLQLANTKNYIKCCEDYSSEDLISQIYFNSSGEVVSSQTWSDATANEEYLCDFILTGYDNGYMYNFSSDVISLQDTHFKMYPVTGSTYCYNYQLIEESGLTYTNLCGGFYQGFYKLYDYDYQVLPNKYINGSTFEVIFRKASGCTCTETLLNESYPDNSNFIFYFGTRATNKFCNINENEIGLTTCDGSESLFDEYEVVQTQIFENSFLYYNNKTVCEFSGYTYEVNLPDCCEDLINNAFGVRITDDGKLNVRLITTTGECVDNKWEKQIVINNYYSEANIVEDNKWYQMVIRFEPYSYNECTELSYGTLSVFLNGKLKLLVKDVKEFTGTELSTSGAKQLGVPYNISVGGGVLGLLESVDVNGHDDSYFSGDTLCNYSFKIRSCFSLKGIIVNDVEYLASELIDYDDVDGIKNFISGIVTNRYGDVEVEVVGYGGYLETEVEIKYSKDVVNLLVLTDSVFKAPYNTKCFDIPEHTLECTLLEDNFAGSFIGDIYSFSIYNRILPVQEINCYLDSYTFIP